MSEMRLRPKSDYLEKANWEQLYILCEHWQKEIAFYKDELRFLRRLVSRYFLWLEHEENIAKANALVVDIKKTEQETEWLDQAIQRHMSHISDLMRNAFSRDEAEFREDHTELEDKMAGYLQLFRKLKSEVFAVSEYIMETEELPEKMPYKTRS